MKPKSKSKSAKPNQTKLKPHSSKSETKKFKVVTKQHYLLYANKSNKKIQLRSGYLIVSDEHVDQLGKVIYSRSDSHVLTTKQLKKLAEKLGWQYRPPSLHYIFRLDDKLKFEAGSVLRNQKTIRNLDGSEVKKLLRD